MTKESTLEQLLQELHDYADEHEASDGTLTGTPIGKRHGVHKAMRAFESFLPDEKLPTSLWGTWIRLLRAAGQRDITACEIAYELREQLRKYFIEFTNELTDTERVILTAIGKETLQSKGIKKKTGLSIDTLKHHLTTLVKRGILRNINGQGYSLTR